MTLAERLLAVHVALRDAGIPHAFGGAVALAYWTHEPRGTRDLDINVFLPPADAHRVRDALPPGVAWTPAADAAIALDGQARVVWEDTPLDLFFDYAPIHADAARHRRTVPFLAQTIPVLAPTELAVFKAMFDRTRDWADIEDMIAAGTLDAGAVREALRGMLDDGDPRLAHLDDAARRAGR